MRRLARATGILLALGGALLLAWAIAVWQWQDPITLVVNKRYQSRLASAYEDRAREFPPAAPRGEGRPTTGITQLTLARRFRSGTETGEPIGRLIVPRMDLEVMVAFGTDTDTLKKGPGLHPSTGLPGQKFLTYIAGHRTTYGAPFSDIDTLRPGDRITFELPYGTYRYVVTDHEIVPGDQIDVLKGRGREELALQACWPRFFASHRYIAYAKLVSVGPATPHPSTERG
jgi:sortase A